MYKETFDIVFVKQGLQKKTIKKWYFIVDLYEQKRLLRTNDIET